MHLPYLAAVDEHVQACAGGWGPSVWGARLFKWSHAFKPQLHDVVLVSAGRLARVNPRLIINMVSDLERFKTVACDMEWNVHASATRPRPGVCRAPLTNCYVSGY